MEVVEVDEAVSVVVVETLLIELLLHVMVVAVKTSQMFIYFS